MRTKKKEFIISQKLRNLQLEQDRAWVEEVDEGNELMNVRAWCECSTQDKIIAKEQSELIY
jgi:hypothetical protein